MIIHHLILLLPFVCWNLVLSLGMLLHLILLRYSPGAYYLFVDYTSVEKLKGKTSMEAAMYLLKEIGVACVNGCNFFGSTSEETSNKYLRFAACRSDEDIEEAIRRLEKLNN